MFSMFSSRMRSNTDQTGGRTTIGGESIWTILIKVIAFLILCCTLIIIAVISYVLLYYLLIPSQYHQFPVYFDHQASGPLYDLPSKRSLSSNSRFGKVQWGPTAIVDLLADHSRWVDFSREKQWSSDRISAAEACSEFSYQGLETEQEQFRTISRQNYASSNNKKNDRNSLYEFTDNCALHGDCPVMDSAASVKPSSLPLLKRLLYAGVEYSISLELEFPSSTSNRNLGMFMIRMDLHSDPDQSILSSQKEFFKSKVLSQPSSFSSFSSQCSNEEETKCAEDREHFELPPLPPPPCVILATSQRPMAVPWVNPLLEKIEALSWIPLVCLSPFMWWSGALRGGASYAAGSGTQKISVEIFDKFYESSAQPLSAVTATISSSDIELYSASLFIRAKMNGFRYYMYHWFWTTALLSIGWIFFIELISLALVYIIFQVATGGGEEETHASSRQSQPTRSHENNLAEEEEEDEASIEGQGYGAGYSGGGVRFGRSTSRDSDRSSRSGLNTTPSTPAYSSQSSYDGDRNYRDAASTTPRDTSEDEN